MTSSAEDQAEIERLKGLVVKLQTYVWHTRLCEQAMTRQSPCICGLDALVPNVPQRTPPGPPNPPRHSVKEFG